MQTVLKEKDEQHQLRDKHPHWRRRRGGRWSLCDRWGQPGCPEVLMSSCLAPALEKALCSVCLLKGTRTERAWHGSVWAAQIDSSRTLRCCHFKYRTNSTTRRAASAAAVRHHLPAGCSPNCSKNISQTEARQGNTIMLRVAKRSHLHIRDWHRRSLITHSECKYICIN